MSYKPHAQKPRALSPEVQDEIVRLVGMGNYLSPACALAGITPEGLYYWQKKYRAGDEDAQWLDDFFSRLAHASAQAEAQSLAAVRDGKMGWQGPAWFLGRRFPKRWSEKARATAAQSTLDPTAPTDEEGNKA
jgi:transposase-like protein